ncbi:hypothetical protein RRF57_001291 [Xylaria bambusicola]|uniref:Uncharacterized protein n=1 Tax=Xylaria bambusicola TaxID=326684 RepID=A0AAN7U4Q1_9PEZI
MQTLTAHKTPMDEEQEYHGVNLERGASEPEAAGNFGEDAVLRDPPCHEGVEAQCRRDGCALEVARLPRGVLRDVGCRDIEASKTCQTAEYKDHEADVIESCAQANAEGYAGRG